MTPPSPARRQPRARPSVKEVKSLVPLVETYIQNMKPGSVMFQAPQSDERFLARVDFGKVIGEPLLSQRDKLPFEVTPIYLKLAYYVPAGAAAPVVQLAAALSAGTGRGRRSSKQWHRNKHGNTVDISNFYGCNFAIKIVSVFPVLTLFGPRAAPVAN